jgi:WD40 repeat protein
LRNLLNDIGRFIREYHSIISEGAMHTYYSALPFVPSQTELYRRYASTEGPHRVTVTRGDIYWNPCLQTSRFEKPIISAAVSGDGAYIAVAFGRSVAILNAATGAQISTLKEIYGMRAIFLSIDGKYLLSLSSDNIIRTWDCRASKEIFGVTDSFRMHVAYVRANELASCIQKIQHVEKKKKRKELPTDIGEALQIAVSSDCKAILAADRWGDSLYMWCSESGRSLLRIHHAHGHKNERRVPSERPIVTCVAFSPEGTCFASGSIMETVKIRDSKTGDVLQTLSHGAEVCSVVFSPDGLSIVSGTAYGAVIFWDTKGGARLRSLKGPSERVTTLAFSSDAAFLVTGYRNSELKIWDCQFVAPTTREDTHSSSVNSIVVSKNGLLIASGSDDSTVRVWNAVDGKLQWKLSGHTYRVTELAISDDGSYIISGSTDRTLRVWSVQTGQATAVLSMESPVGILAFIAIKGLRFASAFSDGEITIWETTTGTKVKDLKGHTAQITSIAVSQDSSRLVSTSRSDGMTWVWDCTTLEAIYQLNSNTADLMAISPDASRMVTGAITFRIWDFKTGVELLNIPTNVRDENGQGDSAQELSFVHDGRYFMARYRSGQCLLWNSMTGERMAPPSPTFSPPKSEQVASSLTQHYTLSMGWIYEINLNGHFLPICKLPSASYKVTSTCFQDDICAVGLENGAVIIMRIPQLSRCRPAQSTSS